MNTYLITTKNWILITGIIVLAGCVPNEKQVQETSNRTISGNIQVPGIKNEPVSISDYAQFIYVNASATTEGDGKKESPYKSLATALENISGHSESNRIAVFVAEGEYADKTILMYPWVDLYGGFSASNWERNIKKFQSVLHGNGERRVVVGADNSRIDGFIITGGEVRGQGAGIYCSGAAPVISNVLFRNNRTLGPKNWNPKYMHETANDGAAVYCEYNSNVIIRNCMFLNNQTENGRGAGIAVNYECNVKITESVFMKNQAGTNDPMRSSDGGAISIFDWCNAEITKNIFLSNSALNRNDAGGVFVALWSSAKVEHNIFVNNDAGDDAGALFVGGQEHRYDAPLDPIPPSDKFFVSISDNLFFGNKNSSMNSGTMRFTMESRGKFINNITALNNGIYFQRSEVEINSNVILDNFLFVETKEGLLPGKITNNVIWADFTLTENPMVAGNIIKGIAGKQGQLPSPPAFIGDGFTFTAATLNVNKKTSQTTIMALEENFTENSLINRVIRSGDKWGVITANSSKDLNVWGDFYGCSSFQILPTYQLK